MIFPYVQRYIVLKSLSVKNQFILSTFQMIKAKTHFSLLLIFHSQGNSSPLQRKKTGVKYKTWHTKRINFSSEWILLVRDVLYEYSIYGSVFLNDIRRYTRRQRLYLHTWKLHKKGITIHKWIPVINYPFSSAHNV